MDGVHEPTGVFSTPDAVQPLLGIGTMRLDGGRLSGSKEISRIGASSSDIKAKMH